MSVVKIAALSLTVLFLLVAVVREASRRVERIERR